MSILRNCYPDMSVIAELTVPAYEIIPDPIANIPDASTIPVERVLQRNDRTILYLWLPNGHSSPGEQVVQTELDNDGLEPVYQRNGQTLARVETLASSGQFLGHVQEAAITVRSVLLNSDTWRFFCEFDDHDQLASLYQATIAGNDIVTVETIIPESEYSTTAHANRSRAGQSTSRYAAIYNSSPDAILLVDSSGHITEVNERLTELLGYNPDELVGEPVEILVPESKRSEHVEHRDSYLEDSETRPMGVDLDLWAEHEDGSIIPVDVSLSPIEHDGQLEVMAAIRDRSKREALRARYRKILTAVPDAVVVAETASGEIVEANEEVSDLLGYDPEELVGQVQSVLHPSGGADRYRELFERHIAAGQTTFTQFPDGSDIEVETKAGERVPVEINAQVFDFQDRQLIVGVFRDISSRRAYERRLERAETIIQASGDAVYMLDPDGRFTFVNDALTTTTGYAESELLGKPVSIVMDEEDIQCGERLIQELLTSDRERGTFEMTVYTADGGEIPTQNHLAIITDDVGRLNASVGVVRDITELKDREAALQRENERLDEFANVVSHDLRNPLTVAQGRTELLREDCESDQLDTVERSLDRMEQLIDELLTLARDGGTVTELNRVGLPAMVKSCWRTVETGGATLQLETERTIRADRTRLRQLFENLFRNAVEHGDDSVTVTIGDLDDGYFVADDGPGIPADKRDAVLEAGYSLSEAGTGLGLSIVNRIVEAHGWKLDVTESADGGARFEFGGIESVD